MKRSVFPIQNLKINLRSLKILYFLMLSRYISKYSFALYAPENSVGLLKKFGITNPIIYRNLTSLYCKLEFLNIMSLVSLPSLQTLTPESVQFLTQELFVLILENAQGTFEIN